MWRSRKYLKTVLIFGKWVNVLGYCSQLSSADIDQQLFSLNDLPLCLSSDFKSSFCPSSHCCSYLTQIHTQNQSINKYLMRRCRRSSSANCRPVLLLLLLLLLSYISSSASAPLSVMQSDVTTDTYRGHDMNAQWGSMMRFINCFLTAEFILHTHTARLYSNNQLLVL